MVIILDLYLRRFVILFRFAIDHINVKLLICLSNDVSQYWDTLDMVHWYSWRLYCHISSIRAWVCVCMCVCMCACVCVCVYVCVCVCNVIKCMYVYIFAYTIKCN